MADTSLNVALEFAVELAERAGEVALELYGSRLDPDRKADATPVTRADRDAERLCRERIQARFPADGILGEEFEELPSGSGRRWVLDPIDGTKSFVHGVPLFGVLVALEEDAESVLGVVHFPALGETVAAARGEGCFWNGGRCRVSDTEDLSRSLVLTTDIEHLDEEARGDAWRRLAGRAGLTRTWGDCYGHALVATGRAEAMVEPVLARWDAAPLLPILEEAGGVFTDWTGARTPGEEGGISTNAALATEIRATLGIGDPGVPPAEPVAQ